MRLYLLPVLLLCLAGIGCGSSESPPQGSVSDDPSLQVDFETPEGWEKESIQGFTYRSLQWGSPEDSAAPFVLIELEVSPGTEVDAKEAAATHYSYHEANGATLTESDIADERLYTIESQSSHAYGGPWWASIVVFEKDGWVVELMMTDRLENQRDAIELLVQSITVEQTGLASALTTRALATADTGGCKELALDGIPVIEGGRNWHHPEESTRQTQRYN